MLLRLDKIGTKVLKWLKEKGASTNDNRVALVGVHVRDKFLEVANEFSVFAAPTPESMKEVEVGSLLGFDKIPAGDNILEPRVIKEAFPDIDELLKNQQNNEYEFGAIDIGIRADHLQNFLAGLPKNTCVKFTVSKPVFAIRLSTYAEGDNPRFALIMPMHLGNKATDNGDAFYNPYSIDENAPTPTVQPQEKAENGAGETP